MPRIAPVTRRELVAAGIAGSAAAVAVAGAAAGEARAGAGAADDAQALHSALATEVLVVFAYERVLSLGVLSSHVREAASHLLAQDRVHARTLAVALSRLGATPPPPPASVADADRQLAARDASGRLAAVHSEDDGLRLLYDVESIAIGAYYEALRALAEPGHVRMASEIMASDAQHATAIGQLLHPGDVKKAVPVSVVKGKR
jgi:hypothetical protein